MSSNEKYVLDSIEEGEIHRFSEKEFINRVKEDAVKNGLLSDAKVEKEKTKRVLVVSISIIILMLFIFAILFGDMTSDPTNFTDWKVLSLGFSISLAIYIPFYLCVYLSTYNKKIKNNNYIRTHKGDEINEKLEGLKNYLKDYSMMNERDRESLILWEDYLIYSVIFNQNTRIVDDIYERYLNN